jgi:hypothetical protein
LNAKGLGSFKVDLNEIETGITIVDYTESPVVNSKSSLIDDTIYKGYVVVKSDLTADRCLLTRINAQGCIDSAGKEVMSEISGNNVFYFCNQRSAFSILELKDDGNALGLYKCPIVVLPYGGESETVSVKVSFENEKNVDLSLDKNILAPGESYTADAPGSYIFTDNGDYAFQHAEFTAPSNDFKIYGYNSGELVSRDIEVTGGESVPLETNRTVSETIEKHNTSSQSFFSKIMSFFSGLFEGLKI